MNSTMKVRLQCLRFAITIIEDTDTILTNAKLWSAWVNEELACPKCGHTVSCDAPLCDFKSKCVP